MAEQKVQQPIAVAAEEAQKWGCPYCGYRSGYSPISGGGTAVVVCGECERSFAVLAEGVTKSTIGFGEFYPELQQHPRKGTPAHGKPDKRPKGGGEFFRSRGIGIDETPGCFVSWCSRNGGRNSRYKTMYNNIAAFVQCKETGERVVAMFRGGVWLDYREYEPDRVQVKIGACDKHLPNLKLLDKLCKDGVIKQEMITAAIEYHRD